MTLRRRTILLALAAAPVAAALHGCGRRETDTRAADSAATASLTSLGEARVAAVPDAATLMLDSGLEVRLAALEPPRRAQGRLADEPLYEEARATLEALALGRLARLEIPEGQPERDRWGRAPARVVLSEGGPDGGGRDGGDVAVNREMVARGLARVRPEYESDAEARALLALEATAREARLGLWAVTFFAVRPAEAVTLSSAGSFQIVEGVVVDAAAVRRWLYLNFGPDWRTDFTAGAPPEFSGAFDADALQALPGAQVRVRGDIERYNGPFIRLVVPAQIERLN